MTPSAARAAFREDRDRRKRQGVFYTPEPVARYLVASTLGPAFQKAGNHTHLTILDPACGDGALLWPAYQFLCDQRGASHLDTRLEIVRRQLLGVDLDPQAIERLHQRFRDDLAAGVSPVELNQVLQRNFRCGNAVNGSGWGTLPTVTGSEEGEKPFDWGEHFPEVCAAGGFDVVIANPPYRRERGAKTDLEHLEQSPLALTHRQARMDLWHYFFHRSLDLLRPGGVMTFIVNSYWTTSHAGRPLIARLMAETTPLEILLLEAAPVFAGVGGRHLIVRLRKEITTEKCRVVRLTKQQQSSVLEPGLWEDLLRDCSGTLMPSDVLQWTSTRDELFEGNTLNLVARAARATRPSRAGDAERRCLGDVFEVRQGIAENPPRVTRKHALANPELRSGEGVFVLSTEELADLKLTDDESQLVRPYFSAADITRFWTVPPTQYWLLYLTRQTAPDLTALPHIEKHLARFRSVLEQRRETQQGKIDWWHLHWPRAPRLFEQPRILAVQMSEEPRFAYVESPTYVGFSVNLIVDRPSSLVSNMSGIPPLEALAVILNSQSAAEWFDAHAKRRGVNLDITGSALKRFPLPEVDPATAAELVRLGRQRCDIESRCVKDEIDVRDEAMSVERLIDDLVAGFFFV